MIIKFLGFLDLMVAGILLLLHFGLVGWNLALFAFVYLALKAIIFFGDLASILDAITGVYIILLLFGIHTKLTYVFIAYMVQKAVFSFL